MSRLPNLAVYLCPRYINPNFPPNLVKLFRFFDLSVLAVFLRTLLNAMVVWVAWRWAVSPLLGVRGVTFGEACALCLLVRSALGMCICVRYYPPSRIVISLR